MAIIKSVKIISLAKVSMLVASIIGLFMGLMAIIVSVSQGLPVNVFQAIMLVIISIVFYGIIGFVLGAIIAWIFNKVSKRIGGLEIELKK